MAFIRMCTYQQYSFLVDEKYEQVAQIYMYQMSQLRNKFRYLLLQQGMVWASPLNVFTYYTETLIIFRYSPVE